MSGVVAGLPRPLVQRRSSGGAKLPSRSNTGVSKTRVSGTGPLVGVPKTLVSDTGEDGAYGAAFPPLVLRCSSGRAAVCRKNNFCPTKLVPSSSIAGNKALGSSAAPPLHQRSRSQASGVTVRSSRWPGLSTTAHTIPARVGPKSIAGNIIMPEIVESASPLIQNGAAMANAALQEIA